MTRGGKREGAGRKPKVETKQVRIPVTMAPAIRQLGEFFMRAAREQLEDSSWFKTCPDTSKNELIWKGIEVRTFGSMLGGRAEVPVLVIIATDGIEETEVLLRLDQIT